MDELEITGGAMPMRRPAFIRQATLEDLAELHGVDEVVFGALAYPIFVLRQFIDVHQRHFLVAADPSLLGYALAAYPAHSDEAWLLGLGVRPEARAYGYGRALLARCLERLRRDGARCVRLTVEPGNHPAIRLYESADFRISDLQRDYYGPGEHRYLMCAALDDQPEFATAAP
jgi:ribosomal-protein-alanine N-acetyltransferase